MNEKNPTAYELRFCSLFDEGRGYAFPCDSEGHVDLDGLSERARENYLYARAVVGREFSMPAVTHGAGIQTCEMTTRKPRNAKQPSG